MFSSRFFCAVVKQNKRALAGILVVSSATANNSPLFPLMLMNELKQEMSTLCALLSSYRDQRLENDQNTNEQKSVSCVQSLLLFLNHYIALIVL